MHAHASFPTDLHRELERVIDEVRGANIHLVPADMDTSDLGDVKAVQEAFTLLGVELEIGEAYDVWSLYSRDNQETWSTCPKEPAEVLVALQSLCRNIRAVQDYAGFSDK